MNIQPASQLAKRLKEKETQEDIIESLLEMLEQQVEQAVAMGITPQDFKGKISIDELTESNCTRLVSQLMENQYCVTTTRNGKELTIQIHPALH